jgi:hypothetical protein
MRIFMIVVTFVAVTTGASAQQCPPGMSGCWDSMQQRRQNDLLHQQMQQQQNEQLQRSIQGPQPPYYGVPPYNQYQQR